MKKVILLVACLAVLVAVPMAVAQMRPITPPQPSQGQAPGGAQTPAQPSIQPMMGSGRTGMMCPMMGQSMMSVEMGPGMMGMADSKAQARILKLRGDMMKAMGEVMLEARGGVRAGEVEARPPVPPGCDVTPGSC